MYDDEFPEDDTAKSKTQVKKEMADLQDLGVAISKLTPEQQSQIPLDRSLRDAIEEAPKIKSNSAKKRHAQFIGKLMRGAEHEEIRDAYNTVMEAAHKLARQHHLVEHWRDMLLTQDQALNDFFDQYPHADRQHVRQLIRAAKQEKSANKPPSSARKLFREIRDTLGSEGDSA